MLKGKDLILATKPYSKENRFLSWYYTLSTLSMLVGLLISAGWNHYIYLRLASSILAGFVFIRFFCIYHDFEHKAILQKSFVAKGIMYVYGLYSLAPPSI